MFRDIYRVIPLYKVVFIILGLDQYLYIRLYNLLKWIVHFVSDIILSIQIFVLVPIINYVVKMFIPCIKYSEEYFIVLCFILFFIISFSFIRKFIVMGIFSQNNLIFKTFRINIYTNTFTADHGTLITDFTKYYFAIYKSIFSSLIMILIDNIFFYCEIIFSKLLSSHIFLCELINIYLYIINLMNTFIKKFKNIITFSLYI
jgi:hypothetical protein